MPILPYHDFDRLRLREFAADEPAYSDEEDEHGAGFWEQIRGVIFARACSRPVQLHTVDLEFEYAPSAIVKAVLDRLGLSVLPFASKQSVDQVCGTPVREKTWPPDCRVAWYEIGDSERYSLRCVFGNTDRLAVIVLARLDFAMDKESE